MCAMNILILSMQRIVRLNAMRQMYDQFPIRAEPKACEPERGAMDWILATDDIDHSQIECSSLMFYLQSKQDFPVLRWLSRSECDRSTGPKSYPSRRHLNGPAELLSYFSPFIINSGTGYWKSPVKTGTSCFHYLTWCLLFMNMPFRLDRCM